VIFVNHSKEANRCLLYLIDIRKCHSTCTCDHHHADQMRRSYSSPSRHARILLLLTTHLAGAEAQAHHHRHPGPGLTPQPSQHSPSLLLAAALEMLEMGRREIKVRDLDLGLLGRYPWPMALKRWPRVASGLAKEVGGGMAREADRRRDSEGVICQAVDENRWAE
jgi:hypothetical protein